MEEKNTLGKNYAIAALVCGILGIVGGVIPVVKYATFILAILGIVFGVMARKRTDLTSSERNMATAGMICGIVGVVISVIVWVVVIIGIGALVAMSI